MSRLLPLQELNTDWVTTEFDNPNALKKYYDLMLAVLRVINAVVVARGAQNEQSTYQALTFLKENRNTMVSIFKRSVNVGLAKDVGEDLNDLVDCFTVLVEMTGFLQVSFWHLSCPLTFTNTDRQAA